MSVLVVTDCHGCWFTLTLLLNQCAAKYPGARLVSLGDEIDRGPNSRAVVEFMMGNGIPSVASNHIDLCLAYSAHARRGYTAHCSSYYERDVWLYNGGDKTLLSWDPNEEKRGGDVMPKDVLDWMAALPAYITPDAPPDDKGRRLLCSHSGYGLDADAGDTYGWFKALWGRHEEGDGEFPDDGWFRAYGHTLVKTPLLTDAACNLDTGAAYASRGFGVLTALHWPSKALIAQRFNESPIKPRFRVVNGCIAP
jgi:hypothetical protein